MKVGFVVAYFGKLPSYFPLFLKSCQYNSHFDWLLFTDDMTEHTYPDNVHRIPMNFPTCRKIVQDHFDFPITLGSPKKLCDYKCAYGYIFQDYLRGYDWWGHCDLDQIFGNLSKFITADMLNKYDKIGSLGHLTLYRNNVDNNQVFKRQINGRVRYKEVFSSDKGFAFDEWLPESINEIFIESERPVMLDSLGADVNSYRTTFQLTDFDLQSRHYVLSKVKNSIFYFGSGKLLQLFIDNGEMQQREFPYVHLQKRKMKDARKSLDSSSYFIVPNVFVDASNDPKVLLRRAKVFGLVNYQYLNVKIQSLKYRMKSCDWKRENVFKQ